MKRLIALVPILALTACVYVQDSHVRNHGTDVSQTQVALVEPGKTDKAWILLHLGTPDRINSDKDGMEVFEYVSERTERLERKFILLFSVESDKVISRKVTRVVLRNGIVESINTVDV
jgi:outer membrane protein assembly factor BamE (lipoprotein component of BamABCDE complex)